jgi:FKBP-type peptidyl-prolyl cis-trans isomerase (trigger factor)
VLGAIYLDGGFAEAEKVDVSESEVEEEISKMASYYRASADEIRESLEKQGGGVESIRNNLKTRKSIEAVVAKAKISDGPWVEEDAGALEKEEKQKKTTKSKSSTKKPSKKDPASE